LPGRGIIVFVILLALFFNQKHLKNRKTKNSMAKTQKIWEAIIYLLAVSVIINGAYFYISSQALTNQTLRSIATVITPVVSAINYIVMGFAAGLGFYLAKQRTGQ
jgi:ABC-type antimicrobial peptide transport system permease subunit